MEDAFASLAQVRILLLPVGKISKDSFDKWAAMIRSFRHIKLEELSPEPGEGRNRFMPPPMSSGYLHLTYPSVPPSSQHAQLAVFRPSSFPLGVIGIANCHESQDIESLSSIFDDELSQLFPRGSVFPLSRRIYAFEDGDQSTDSNLGSSAAQVVVLPSVMGNKQLYVGTLITELCSEILADFSRLANALESEASLEVMNSRLFPILALSKEGEDPGADVQPGLSQSVSVTSLSAARGSMDMGSNSISNGIRPMPKRSTTTIPSSNSPQLTTPASNTKKRSSLISNSSANGRMNKIVGDLYLLAGRTTDAVQWYLESLPMLKGAHDVIWQASAVEGMCTAEILDAWASGEIESSSTGSKQPWTDIAERLNQATGLYARAIPSGAQPTSFSPTGKPLDGELCGLSFLFCQSILRHTHLLIAIWNAKGWGKAAVERLLRPFTALHSKMSEFSDVTLHSISTSTGLSRSDIAAVIGQAHGPHLMHLQPNDTLFILNSIASTYFLLQLERKRAYILREVSAVLVDLLVTSREEEAISSFSGYAGAIGLGIAGLTNGLQPSPRISPIAGTVSSRPTVQSEGNDSILSLVRQICRVYGVRLSRIGLKEVLASEQSTESGESSAADVIEAEEPFGWPELQMGAVREAVAIAETLPDYPAVAQFCLSTLQGLRKQLAPSEQSHLHATAAKALGTSRRRGNEIRVDYWAGNPIYSVEILPLHSTRQVQQNPISALQSEDTTGVAAVRRGPFIYDPRKSTSSTKVIAVQDEPLEVVITLQNAFPFNLEGLHVSLKSAGVEMRAPSITTAVPADSYKVLRLSVTPLGFGTLQILGISAQMPFTSPCTFKLPFYQHDDVRATDKRQSIIVADRLRMKKYGLGRYTAATDALITQESTEIPALSLSVAERQPLLHVKRTNLTHGTLMLYDGERITIKLTLENISPTSIDFIKASFNDSTIAPIQTLLAEGELPIAEAYEAEYNLVNRPVLTWLGLSDPRIEPGKRVVAAVACFGKRNCFSASIQISYSFVEDLQKSSASTFYTRVIHYPIAVTVLATLECRAMDITPYWSHHRSNQADKEDLKFTGFDVEHPEDWCLVTVDIHNRHTTPFEVTLERVQPDYHRLTTSHLVSPRSTVRFILPLRRVLLDQRVTSSDIPALSDRQFVVAKDKLPSNELKMQLEVFWYREHLLSCLKARWRESGTPRHGEISLRSQRLTLPMLQFFRRPACHVFLSLLDAAGEPFTMTSDQRVFAPQHVFLTLQATVTNLTDTRTNLVVSILLASLGLLESVIFDSPLSQNRLGPCGPSETVSFSVGTCFVDEGTFDFRAAVDSSEPDIFAAAYCSLSVSIEGD